MSTTVHQAPPAAYLGWDEQFTRITRNIAPRILRLVRGLGEECAARGYKIRISHQLGDAGVGTQLLVLDDGFTPTARFVFVLSDGWVLCGKPGARLDVELFSGFEDRQVVTGLTRVCEDLSNDADDVFSFAGEGTDMRSLQGALAPLL